MMKRITALLLVFLLAFSLTACTVSESDVSAITDLAETVLSSDQESAAATDTAQDAAPAEAEASSENADESPAEPASEPAEYTSAAEETQDETITDNLPVLDENGTYDSKDEVALYIYQYGHLPDNYITKKEAQALGWSGGSLEPYAPGKCIGGSYFGNYEGILPTADGREYHECDIDTLGASSRGAKRIVFSNDGLIYYTEDHYETFELLYGDDVQ